MIKRNILYNPEENDKTLPDEKFTNSSPAPLAGIRDEAKCKILNPRSSNQPFENLSKYNLTSIVILVSNKYQHLFPQLRKGLWYYINCRNSLWTVFFSVKNGIILIICLAESYPLQQQPPPPPNPMTWRFVEKLRWTVQWRMAPKSILSMV